MLIDVMNDHDLEQQLVQFPTREKNILDLILTSPLSVSGNTFPRQT